MPVGDFGFALGQELEMRALGTEHEFMLSDPVVVTSSCMAMLTHVIGLVATKERDAIVHINVPAAAQPPGVRAQKW